jgi:hypothetical protein
MCILISQSLGVNMATSCVEKNQVFINSMPLKNLLDIDRILIAADYSNGAGKRDRL